MSRLRALRLLPLLLAAVVAGGAAGAVEARPVATAPNDAAMEKLERISQAPPASAARVRCRPAWPEPAPTWRLEGNLPARSHTSAYAAGTGRMGNDSGTQRPRSTRTSTEPASAKAAHKATKGDQRALAASRHAQLSRRRSRVRVPSLPLRNGLEAVTRLDYSDTVRDASMPSLDGGRLV